MKPEILHIRCRDPGLQTCSESMDQGIRLWNLWGRSWVAHVRGWANSLSWEFVPFPHLQPQMKTWKESFKLNQSSTSEPLTKFWEEISTCIFQFNMYATHTHTTHTCIHACRSFFDEPKYCKNALVMLITTPAPYLTDTQKAGKARELWKAIMRTFVW